jgi:hypothetical protein
VHLRAQDREGRQGVPSHGQVALVTRRERGGGCPLGDGEASGVVG